MHLRRISVPPGNKMVFGPHIKHIRLRSRIATAHVWISPQDIHTWWGGGGL